MSDGISFDTISEANEYIKEKQNEGYEAYYIPKDTKYIVHILGKISGKHPIIKKVNKDEMYFEGSGGEYDLKKNEIRFANNLNTKGKTHEIGHAILGHADYDENTTAKQIAKEEIEAQIFAYSKNDKSIDFRVAIPAIILLVKEDTSAKESIKIIKEVLKEKGIEFPGEYESQYLNYLKKEKGEN